LVEIIFQSRKDASRLYSHLLLQFKSTTDIEKILLIEDRYIVKVMVCSMSSESLHIVKDAFYEFIIRVKRNDWFRTILKVQYYYEDQEEQEQIIDIINSIIEGEREELVSFIKNDNDEEEMKDAIDQIFRENVSFSFESFTKFRLRSYLKRLESYVGISIDEYKMEQEYQMFIQTLREFLTKQQPKIGEIHVVFNDEVSFYNEHLYEIKRSDLIKMIDRKLLFNHPVYVDSVTIAPLLSIAPTSIFLYCQDREKPLIRTIENIFEERINLKPISHFNELYQNKCKDLEIEFNKRLDFL
jgi:putative sporulation protein YtxC